MATNGHKSKSKSKVTTKATPKKNGHATRNGNGHSKAAVKRASAKTSSSSKSEKPKIQNEDFVRIWQGATRIEDVITATGMKRQACCSKAYAMRGRGVKLKKFKVSDRVDWAGLAKLADSCKAKSA